MALVEFRTGPMTDGIKRWCMHSTMVCVTVTVSVDSVCALIIPSGIGTVQNCKVSTDFPSVKLFDD